VAQSALEGRKDARLVVTAHGDDEREAELLTVRPVQPLEAFVLLLGEAIEIEIVWGPKVREKYARAEVRDPNNAYHIELRHWFQ